MDTHLLNNPVTVAVVLVAVIVVLWALSKNWRALRAVQEELHGQIKIVVAPIIDSRLTEHNRDENAHEAAGIKVRKERAEMFNDLRDRIEQQHSELLEAITEVRANQTQMKEALGEVVKSFGTVARQHEDLERRFSYLQKQHNQLHNRETDLAGRSFDEVRLNLNLPKRANDPEGEDHRGERK